MNRENGNVGTNEGVYGEETVREYNYPRVYVRDWAAEVCGQSDLVINDDAVGLDTTEKVDSYEAVATRAHSEEEMESSEQEPRSEKIHFVSDASDEEEVLGMVGEKMLTREGVIEFDGDFIKHDIVSDKFCPHNVRDVKTKCPCFLYKKQGDKFLFDETMRRDAAIISQEYNIGVALDRADFVLKKYVRHQVVVLALSTKDNKITTKDLTRPDMLKYLYILREMYDNFTDFGQKVLQGTFVAEGGPYLTKLWDFVEKFKSPAKTLVDFVKDLFAKFTSLMTGFLDVVSQKMAELMKKAFSNAANIIVGCITDGLYDTGALWLDPEVKVLIVFFGILISVMLIEAIGIMTFVIVKPLLKLMSEKYTPKPKAMLGEGEVSMMSLLIMTVVGIMKLSSNDESAILAKVKTIGSLLQSCSHIGGGLMVAFLILPQVIQDAIKCRFSPYYAQKIATENWMSRTHALVMLSKQVKVVAHPTYRKWLMEQYVEGAKVKKTLTDKTLMPMFMRAFSELIKILSIVNSIDENERTRPLPFCFHLAAEPGMGKSLLVDLFMKAAGSEKHYSRSMADPYHSGLLDHDGIFMDEFFEVDPEKMKEQGKEYLGLNSSVTYKPSMPSLDNLSCGIKGTNFIPKVVGTASNATHPGAPSGFKQDAILRRRHLTMEMVQKPGTTFYKDNRVDIAAMTDAEIRSGAWANFRIHQNLRPGIILGEYNLQEMLAITKKMGEDHRMLCERVSAALNVGHDEAFDPSIMLNDLLRDMNGIPNETKSIFEVVKDWFMGTFVGEGPPPKGMDSSSEAGSSSTSDTKNRKARRVKEALKKNGRSTKEANERRINHYIKKGDLNEEDYFSSEENAAPTDVIADLAHENVDHTRYHRHMCSHCGRQFAHKHDNRNHVSLCLACEAAGLKEGLIWSKKVNVVAGPSGFDPLHLGPDLGLTTMTDNEITELTERIRTNFYSMDMRFFTGEYAPVLSQDVRSFFNTMKEPSASREEFLQDFATCKKANYICTGFDIMQKIILLWMIVKAVRYFSRPNEEESVVCFAESPKPNRESHKAHRNHWRVENYAQGNSRTLMVDLGNLDCYSLPIEGRTLIMHSHVYFDELGEKLPLSTTMTVTYAGKRFMTTLAECRVRMIEEKDLIVVTLPPNCTLDQFPKSIKKFIKEEDLDSFSFGSGSLDIGGVTTYVRIQRDRNREYCYGKKVWRLEDCFGYVAQTQRGDCGKPIIAQGNWAPGKIIGVHVAGGMNEKLNQKVGMGTFITQEFLNFLMKDEPMDISSVVFTAESFQGPNLIKMTRVPKSEQVHLPRVNRIKESVISKDLDLPKKRSPSLMSPEDPRAEGVDPLVTAISNLVAVEQPKVNEEIFSFVAEEQRTYWMDVLHRGKVWVPLSIEEAIGGVPGRLASLKISSSSGYPLCKINDKPGKKSLFWYEGQELVIESSFRSRVYECYEQIANGEEYPSRFVSFLKDELTSSSKIDAKTCRVIFSGDVTLTVVGRMLYGNFLIAFHESRLNTPSAIGLNQYSWDMQHIHHFLKRTLNRSNEVVGYIAGDFKNFDQNMIQIFQLQAYDLIGELSRVPWAAHESFISTQTKSPIQVMDNLLYLQTSHFSGCFFTTILNILVHELYIRYIFKEMSLKNRRGNLNFEDELSLIVLGDDHIYGVSNNIKGWFNPVTIAESLKKIGQTYTSDDKTAQLTTDLRKFEEITFLGAHPIRVDGRWCGALKKATLFETLHWTRNNNLTIYDECRQMMEYASIWGHAFYSDYVIRVNRALMDNSYPRIEMEDCDSMALTVAARTAQSGEDFSSILSSACLHAQGVDNGITKLHSRLTLDGHEFSNSSPSDQLVDKSTMVPSAVMTLPTDSLIPRDIVSWTTDQQPGTVIKKYKAPFDILKLGPSDNLQNTVFSMWELLKSDVEVAVQINGQPMTQGMLAMYWQPLAEYEAEYANILTNSHVKITPTESGTFPLRCPYVYPRNLISISEKEEFLGTIFIVVISPLKSPEGTTVDLTVSFGFPQAQFRIPSDKIEPTIAKSASKFYTLNHYSATGKVTSTKVWLQKENYGSLLNDTKLSGQGAGQSTVNNVTYTNMGGTMPIQDAPVSLGVAQDMKADQKAEISAIPFHNPPLASGSVPTHQVFAGMSTTVGVEPVVDLQLHPAAMNRQSKKIYNALETNLSVLMGKEGIMALINITTGQLTNAQLYKILLNSIFGVTEGDGIPINIVALNQFFFWHASVILKFYAIKTRFHSTRLSGIVNYGIPDVRADSRSVAYNHIIDFSGENSKFDLVIDWNAQLEWLRTFEGYEVLDPFQDYAMGTFGLFLNNRLTAPNSVDQSVQLLITLELDNARVAVPRAYSPFTIDDVERLSVPAIAMIITPTNGVGVKGFIAPTISGSHDFVQFNSSQVEAPATTGFYQATGSGTLVERNKEGAILGSRVLPVVNVMITANDVSFQFSAPIVFYSDYDNENSEFVFESVSLVLDKRIVLDTTNLRAEGPDPDNVDAETVHEDPSPQHTTEQVESQVHSVPCRLDIGEKFEKRVVDILEIERRMRRLDPRLNASLNQFVAYTSVNGSATVAGTNYINFGVQPSSKWTRCFAGWAGTIIYRIFSYTPHCDVVFQPFANTSISKGIPVIDPINGAQFQMLDKVVTSTSMTSGPMARERTYQTGDSSGWITVSVPFQQQKNFCSTTPTQRISQLSNGTLAISYESKRPDIFFKVGDDMGYYVYRAPIKTNFDMTAFKDGFAGFN
nr:putative polyprotein [Pyongtaek Culex picornavirus]